MSIPAFFTCIASTLQLVSLNFIASSVYQMLRGGTVVTTFLFSICFLKIKVAKYQVVGSILVVIGILVVGVSALAFSSSATSSRNSSISTGSTVNLCVVRGLR